MAKISLSYLEDRSSVQDVPEMLDFFPYPLAPASPFYLFLLLGRFLLCYGPVDLTTHHSWSFCNFLYLNPPHEKLTDVYDIHQRYICLYVTLLSLAQIQLLTKSGKCPADPCIYSSVSCQGPKAIARYFGTRTGCWPGVSIPKHKPTSEGLY